MPDEPTQNTDVKVKTFAEHAFAHVKAVKPTLDRAAKFAAEKEQDANLTELGEIYNKAVAKMVLLHNRLKGIKLKVKGKHPETGADVFEECLTLDQFKEKKAITDDIAKCEKAFIKGQSGGDINDFVNWAKAPAPGKDAPAPAPESGEASA